MIKYKNLSYELPYIKFKEFYDLAYDAGQESIEAISVSSFSKINNEVDSRFVNLKEINQDKFIFYTNYDSPKSVQFKSHNQISAVTYWNKINLQIRIKAKISKTDKDSNNKYFLNRSPKKNALAISSNQSNPIASYSEILKKYKKVMEHNDLTVCPNYWGGYSFTPYYFEFWEGRESRLNKREAYEKSGDNWKHLILQP